MPHDEAMTLLKAHVGPGVVEAELKAAKALLKGVGYLPLAIELAGKRLASLARKPGHHLQKLWQAVEQRASEALTLSSHPGLAAIFAITYDALSEQSQQLFRWLGAFANAPLHLADVAGVIGLSEAKVEKELDALVMQALLAWGETERTYTLHPLLHQYAKTLLVKTDAAEATETVIKYYFNMARKAAQKPHSFAEVQQSHPHILKALEKIKEYYHE